MGKADELLGDIGFKLRGVSETHINYYKKSDLVDCAESDTIELLFYVKDKTNITYAILEEWYEFQTMTSPYVVDLKTHLAITEKLKELLGGNI